MRGRRVVFSAPERVELEEFEVPSVGDQEVLIRTEVSLISAGTELTALLGGHKTERYPVVPGYSNVGIVEQTGAGVTQCAPGDRVLTEGRHASHSLVDLSPQAPRGPAYLQVVPGGVSPEAASFGVLGSVAIHGVRKAEPQLRQSAAVIGQGTVGQLLAQLLRIAGCAPVIGIDVVPMRLAKAQQSGTPVVINAHERDLRSAVEEVTHGAGVDLGFDATRSTDTLPILMDIAALSGKVIVVGSIPGTAEVSLFNPLQTKELTIIGAWQPRSPVAGHAYFPWTQRRNRRDFLDLLADGQVRVQHLVTHRIAPRDAPQAYAMMRAGGDDWLGIVYDWSPGGNE